MTHLLPALALSGLLALPGAAFAQGTPPDAAERCEAAVADALREARGKAVQEIHFRPEHRAVNGADSEEIGVKGEGRYRLPAGTIDFSYSCAVHPRSGRTSGVLFRELGGPPSAAAAGWQPDLVHLNPLACETAVADVLKDRHPRVTGISFSGDTRRLVAAERGRTAMEGRGQLRRAEGMAARPFGYRCEFERGSPQVVRAVASD